MKTRILNLTILLAVLLIVPRHVAAQLVVPEEAMADGGAFSIPIAVSASGFTAFQADVDVTEDLLIGDVSAVLGEELSATHQLVASKLSNGKLRVMVLSLSNKLIPVGTTLCNLTINSSGNSGMIYLSSMSLIDPKGFKTIVKDMSVSLGKNVESYPEFKATITCLRPSEYSTPDCLQLNVDGVSGFSAFQADIVVPSYVDVDADDITLTNRALPSHTLSAEFIDETNTLRIVCVSMSSECFDGHSGPVADIPIRSIEFNGFYEIDAVNIKVSTPEGILYALDDCKLQLLVDDTSEPECGLTMSAVSGKPADQLLLPVNLVHNCAISSFQANLSLPKEATYDAAGVKVASERVTDHLVTSTHQSDGSRLLMGVSLTASPFAGRSGDKVCDIPFTIEKPGVYAAKLENVVCSTPDGKAIYAPGSAIKFRIANDGVTDIEIIENGDAEYKEFTVIVVGKQAHCTGIEERTEVRVYDTAGRLILTTHDSHFDLPMSGVYIVSAKGYIAKKILVK